MRPTASGEDRIVVGVPERGEPVLDEDAAQARVERQLAESVRGLHLDLAAVVVGELALDPEKIYRRRRGTPTP